MQKCDAVEYRKYASRKDTRSAGPPIPPGGGWAGPSKILLLTPTARRGVGFEAGKCERCLIQQRDHLVSVRHKETALGDAFRREMHQALIQSLRRQIAGQIGLKRR